MAENQAENMSDTSHSEGAAPAHDNSDQIALAGETSPGVKRIEALSKHFTLFDRCILLFSVFVVAYCYSLHFTLSSVYTVYSGRIPKKLLVHLADYHHSRMRRPTSSTIPSCQPLMSFKRSLLLLPRFVD